MLSIIGLGIGDEKDISLRGIEACRDSDEVVAELYTAMWQGDLKKLGTQTGKIIRVLERKDLEEGAAMLVEGARKRDIALLVPGDPLSATMHLNLVMEARKAKVPFRIIHSSSIMTAVAETGLSLYSFGRTATVVRPQKGYKPTSFYEAGALNREHGLHTLFLLDVDMGTKEGLEVLLAIEKKLRKGLMTPETRVIAASRLGLAGSRILYGEAGSLLKKPLQPPAVLIVPGRMHFLEQEFLDSL